MKPDFYLVIDSKGLQNIRNCFIKKKFMNKETEFVLLGIEPEINDYSSVSKTRNIFDEIIVCPRSAGGTIIGCNESVTGVNIFIKLNSDEIEYVKPANARFEYVGLLFKDLSIAKKYI